MTADGERGTNHHIIIPKLAMCTASSFALGVLKRIFLKSYFKDGKYTLLAVTHPKSSLRLILLYNKMHKAPL